MAHARGPRQQRNNSIPKTPSGALHSSRSVHRKPFCRSCLRIVREAAGAAVHRFRAWRVLQAPRGLCGDEQTPPNHPYTGATSRSSKALETPRASLSGGNQRSADPTNPVRVPMDGRRTWPTRQDNATHASTHSRDMAHAGRRRSVGGRRLSGNERSDARKKLRSPSS